MRATRPSLRRLTSINADLVFRESLTTASTSDRSSCSPYPRPRPALHHHPHLPSRQVQRQAQLPSRLHSRRRQPRHLLRPRKPSICRRGCWFRPVLMLVSVASSLRGPGLCRSFSAGWDQAWANQAFPASSLTPPSSSVIAVALRLPITITGKTILLRSRNSFNSGSLRIHLTNRR